MLWCGHKHRMRPQYTHNWMDSLEQTPASEGFEDFAGPDARSLVIKSLFKLLIKQKRFSDAPKHVAQLELWLL